MNQKSKCISVSAFAVIMMLASCDNSGPVEYVDMTTSDDVSPSVSIDEADVLYQDFGLTYTEGDSLYLWGKFPLNKEMTLIDFKRNKVIVSRTKGYRVSKSGAFDPDVLTELNDHESFDYYSINGAIAIFKEYSELTIMNGERENSQKILNMADSLARNIDMGKAFKDFDEVNVRISGTPEVIKYESDFTFYLVSYVDENTNSLKLILWEDGRIEVLAGPCSSETIGVYKMDGEMYIHSISNCCGCGQVNYTVHKISAKQLELLYENSDFSM